ncbi:hypothetical protein ABFA07_002225 [Porites harrisoni]
MGLPEVDGLDDIVTKENVERMRRLERQKTDKAKKQLVTFKQNRQLERQKSRQYTKHQRIIHTYGQTADEELNEEATRAVEENLQIQQTQAATKACVCGGTDHLRRSSVRCALNKKNQ